MGFREFREFVVLGLGVGLSKLWSLFGSPLQYGREYLGDLKGTAILTNY